MLKIKRISSLLLVAFVFTTMSTNASASENLTFNINGKTVSMHEIAQKSHLDVSGLTKYYKESPDKFLADANELFREDTIYFSTRSTKPNTSGTNVRNLSALVKRGRKGDILISGTNTSKLVFRHGHAALIYDKKNIIQAVGYGYDSVKSPLSRFGKAEKVRLYRVVTASNYKAAAAAEYANKNLIGIKYDIFSTADSKKELNCATLVWQAYKSQNIELKRYFHSVSPESLVNDRRTVAVANINWPGNQHSFDI